MSELIYTYVNSDSTQTENTTAKSKNKYDHSTAFNATRASRFFLF